MGSAPVDRLSGDISQMTVIDPLSSEECGRSSSIYCASTEPTLDRRAMRFFASSRWLMRAK
jgi:hypothetical protein